jgi:dUTP pyrophosphatase
MGSDVGRVEVLVMRTRPDALLPQRAHPGDAGWDLYADHDCHLKPGQRALIGTGLRFAFPAGYVGLVHPRSGRAWREGLGIVNAPGVIDAGYRGEVQVIAVNHDQNSDIVVERGDRIAQLLIQRVYTPVFTEVGSLPEASRGESGFGSSGS